MVPGQFQLGGHVRQASINQVLRHLNGLPVLPLNMLGHPTLDLLPLLSNNISAGEENLQYQITEVTEFKDTETKEIR